MKTKLHSLLILLTCFVGVYQAIGQSTAFTYQGRLNVSGNPANGRYDFIFQVFDAVSAGSSIGGSLTTANVSVTNGLFVVVLDFGATPFTGPTRWLQIQVSTNGAGLYSVLTPRQLLTPAPYTIYASTAGTVTNGAIANAQLAANSVAAGNIQNSTITAGKIASGQVVKSLNGLADGVSLMQGANVTINTVGNSLQISAPAGGLALPYSGTFASANSIFTLANSGAGPAAAFLGNVGIGTTTPPNPLSVRGGARPISWERYVGGVQSGKTWAWEVDGAGTYLRNATDVTLPLTVLNGGNVGIGTTSPEAILSLYSPGNDLIFKLEDRRTATSGDFLSKQAFYDYGGEAAYIGLRHNLYLGSAPRAIVFGLSGSEKMRINNDGNVGIGTTSPQASLHAVNPNGNYGQLGTPSAGVIGARTGNATFGALSIYLADDHGHNSYAGVFGQAADSRNNNIYPTNWAGYFRGPVQIHLNNSDQQHYAAEIEGSLGLQVHGLVDFPDNVQCDSFLTVGSGDVSALTEIVNGTLYVSGDIQLGGDLNITPSINFQIDHPLDPASRILTHSSVESPDQKNLYDGIIVTDENGEAIISLPAYFEALNRDFRYQLTVLGQFAQAIVANEITNNQFTIKTDKPMVKVSWQVTGSRQDAYAKAHPTVVEQNKPLNERGKYLSPSSYGLPEEMGISYAKRHHSLATSRK